MDKKTLIHKLFTPFRGFALSAILLTVCQAPFDLSFLAWVAWVPFMLATRPEVSVKRLLTTAYFVGLAYWVGNLYWLQIVTLPGYITFSLSQALYWPILAYCVRFIRQKQWPVFFAAPIIFVGAEAWQGVLYTGFHWYYLGHSQYENLRMIQICDIFGVLGLSTLIAFGNGLFVDLILLRKPRRPGLIGRLTSLRFYELIGFHALLFSTLIYGHCRLTETPQYQTDGPKLGSVQPNVPSHVKEEIENGRMILNELIANSKVCAEAGAVLTAWPETMVLAPINAEYRAVCRDGTDALIFHKFISEHCKQSESVVLAGASAADIGIENNQLVIANQYNSALLYHADGSVDPKRYDKIHLVPFGEYIPFKESCPPLFKMIMWLSPYDYDYNLTPGDNYSPFTLPVADQTWRFGVLICYEDTDPTVTRKIVLDENGKKECDWLVNISNDGWYVFFKDGKVRPTVELAQRTAISVFRCVENRIAIIRSVNTGISCLIEPTGAIRDGYEAGNLPEKAMDRQGVAGWFVDTVPIDSRVTIFSRFGRWLDVVMGAGLVILWAIAIVDSRKKKQKAEGTKNEKKSD